MATPYRFGNQYFSINRLLPPMLLKDPEVSFYLKRGMHWILKKKWKNASGANIRLNPVPLKIWEKLKIFTKGFFHFEPIRFMKTMKTTADFYFSETADEFDSGYAKSPVFKERFSVWTNLWPAYLPETGNILDLGCGSGVFSLALGSRGYRVTGIDGANNMISLCNKRKSELKDDNVNFMLSKIPFDKTIFSHPFNAVISSSVLEYIEDLDKVLADVYSILSTHGIFMVSMPNSRAFYRNLERISWKILRRPKYLEYVRHVVDRNEFNSKVCAFGFELLHSQYYGRQNKLSGFLPEAIASTLFVSVFVKKDSIL
jgi:2-polyprenyl-3-methyl-5-hydroxy-6-metoxy-1,4-benzoquinol methylase